MVADTINSIKTHLGEAYSALEEKEATIPEKKNVENLADSILSISGGGEPIIHPNYVTFQDYSGSEMDISWLRTDRMTTMRNMFKFSTSNNVKKLDVSKFDTSNVTDMYGMFQYCKSVSSLNLSSFNFSKVTNISYMFNVYNASYGAKLNSLTFPDVVDLRKCTNFSYLFQNCNVLKSINGCQINNWQIDGTKITTLSNAFNNAGLEEIDMSNWELSYNSLNINNIFSNSKANKIKVPKITATGLTVITEPFYYCQQLRTIEGLENWNIPNVTSLYRSFYSCANLTSLDLSSWNLTLKQSQYTFQGCSKLMRLDIRGLDYTGCTSYANLLTSVPSTCLIIVKDEANKQWFNSKFSAYTNVKTADELGEN